MVEWKRIEMLDQYGYKTFHVDGVPTPLKFIAGQRVVVKFDDGTIEAAPVFLADEIALVRENCLVPSEVRSKVPHIVTSVYATTVLVPLTSLMVAMVGSEFATPAQAGLEE